MSNPTATAAPLDDVMLAMDVVDTLRHRQDLVTRELDAEAREKELIEKLRRIYHEQGIEVPDHVLREGVAALEESRFAYRPPAPGLGTFFARLYVTRARWGKGVLAFLLVVILGLGAYNLGYKPFVASRQEAARIELAETLPAQMDALYQSIFEITKVQQAAAEAQETVRRGKAAAQGGDRAGAEEAIAALNALRDQLQQSYSLRIANREGVEMGFWRIPPNNRQATNFYIVVEALDANGTPLKMPIRNEETGRTEIVDVWGLRVPKEIFDTVEADFNDDGIVQNNRIGVKEEGYLEVQYLIPDPEGMVTEW